MPLDAVVFDLDGVLIDSEQAWDMARRQVVAESGGRWRASATRAMMGMSSIEWSRYMHTTLALRLPVGEINDRVVARLLATYAHALPVLPGAVRVVRELAAHWPLGLASSSNRTVIDAVLRAMHVENSFRAVVSSEELAHGKPAPDVYLAAAELLRVEPVHAVAIEDSTNGIRAAAAAGMAVVAVPNRHYPPEPDALPLAALTLQSLEELTPSVLASAFGDASGPA